MGVDDRAIGFEVVLEPGRGDGDRSMELASTQLARELNGLPDTTARRKPAPPPPPGSRAGEGLAEVLRLSVEFAPLAAVILQGVQLFGNWSALRPGRKVRLRRRGGEEMEVTGLSAEDQRRLIDSWLDGREDSPDDPDDPDPAPENQGTPPDGQRDSS
ncbi:hypothetical protein ACF09Y_01750 [Streptomyces massasporeus]|uniref:effector-associated constant component EACC1 n=1 Tax=Streptomyces massasporeus TaxID=67324 RepID=UPI0036F54FD7